MKTFNRQNQYSLNILSCLLSIIYIYIKENVIFLNSFKKEPSILTISKNNAKEKTLFVYPEKQTKDGREMPFYFGHESFVAKHKAQTKVSSRDWRGRRITSSSGGKVEGGSMERMRKKNLNTTVATGAVNLFKSVYVFSFIFIASKRRFGSAPHSRCSRIWN